MAYITGTYRNENIYGTSENDTIDGKGGSDFLKDYYTSNDTYVFNLGYGQMPIIDKGGDDTILFGDGITAQSFKFYKSPDGSLMARIKDTNNKPEVRNWFLDPRYKIETFSFQDGSSLTKEQIDSMVNFDTNVIIASSNADSVKTTSGDNLVYLMQGDDIFTSTGGNNIVEASSGNDLIYHHGSGNDETYMGGGTDYTEDYGGNDRYIYNKGDAADTILDLGGNDTVKFGIGFVKDNLIFSKEGDNLVVRFSNSSADKLTVKNWVKSSDNRIERLELWDGSYYTSQEIDKKIGIVTEPEPDPVFTVPTPTVTGTDSYNSFSGFSGDDVYYLKKGNDRVMDYVGNDTYLFYRGDGQDNITDQQGSDRVIFAGGITKNDVMFQKDPNNSENLLIKLNNSTDSININKWFRSANYQIEKVMFSNGEYYTNIEINDIINPIIIKPVDIVGTDGNDNLVGNDFDNTFQAGLGNDTINDPFGNDTYIFNQGDGLDVINDASGSDTIRFGTGITKDSLEFIKKENDMVIKAIGSNDQITIQNWYSSFQNKIDNFSFVDGSSLTSLDAENKAAENWASYGYVVTYLGTDGYNYPSGLSGNDVYYLKKGNDRVMDYLGDDTYLFKKGDGIDNITDQGGNDSIVFGLDVSKSDISFNQQDSNLIMSINGSTDSINVNKWFKNANYQIEKVQFLDGTFFTNSEINEIIQQMSSYSAMSEPVISTTSSDTSQQDTILVPVI